MMLLPVILLLVLLHAFPAMANVTLVRDGEPQAVIVTVEEPTLAVQLAVGELNSHLKKITGVELEVARGGTAIDLPRILVGESAATRKLGLANDDFARQEYLIRTAGNDLILMGHDSARKGQLDYEGSGVWGGFDFFEAVGSAYAVYDFLERVCGVRWYLPTEVGTVIPKQTTLTVGELDIRRRPWSRYRMVWPWQFMPASLYQWDMSSPEKLRGIERLPHREVRLFWLRQRMGGEAFRANHSFLPWPYRFRKSHPEYFAVNADGSINTKQLNYASDAVKQQVVKDILAWHRGNPKDEDGHYRFHHPVVMDPVFPVVPMDNASWSRDAASRALLLEKAGRRIGGNTDRASRYVFQFVADVARHVAEQEPDITISTLAYANYLFPPKDVDFPDNVSVMVCKQQVKARTLDWDEPYYDVIREWKERVNNVYVWEYYNFPQFRKMDVFPGLVPLRIGRDVAKLHELGVVGEFLEYNTAARFPHVGHWLVNPAKEHLNYYFNLKLLDTLERPIEELLDEYYRIFYGPAAEPMRTFFTLIEDTYMNQELLPDGGYASGLSAGESWDVYCPPEKLKHFGEYIARAREQTDGRPPYQERVALMDHAVYQFMKTTSERRRFAYLDRLPRWEGLQAVAETVQAERMSMSTNDAAQGRPFILETPRSYLFAGGRGRPADPAGFTQLTDADAPNTPRNNVYLLCSTTNAISMRCELGPPPPRGRQLDAVHVWWDFGSKQRYLLNVKFAVRDATTGTWRDITKYLTIAQRWNEHTGFRVLRIPFPPGGVIRFDAIRMTDGSARAGFPNTRFIEIDVFCSPLQSADPEQKVARVLRARARKLPDPLH